MKPSPRPLALLLLCVVGCASTKAIAPPSQAGIGAASAVARIGVHADVITSQAKQLPVTPQQLLIVEHAGDIKTDVVDVNAQLEQARVDEKLMAGSINDRDQQIAVLKAEAADENNRFIAPRGWRYIHWAFGIGIAILAAGVAFGVVSPLGWGMTISKFVNTLLPLSTPFVWIRDWIIARVRGQVPTYVAK